jgi:predicted component of type VI protein secretion system
MAYLQVETPEGMRHVSLEGDRLTVGRLPTNDVMLPFPQVSRHHAELRRAGEGWWIADLQSTNGVSVSGARVERSSVRPGDVVQLAPGITLTLVAGDTSGDLSAMPTTAMPAVGASFPPGNDAADAWKQAIVHAPFAPPPLPDFSPPWPDMDPAALSPSLPADAPGHPTGSAAAPERNWSTSSDAFGWAGTYGGMRGPNASQPGATGGGADVGDDPLEGDLFRRKRAWRLNATTAGPAPMGDDSTPATAMVMLHLCQTCGQLTAPDVVRCQSCGHGIARPCRACGLSILPIHDCCPRCQAPNPASVLRAHRRRAGGA